MNIPLVISQSTVSTETNKTGFWRYVRPEFVQKTAPCSAACPAGEDIARIESLVTRGFPKQALESLLIENPFPSVCGRVCFHPCERACNRKNFDEAVSIRCIERYLGDQAFEQHLQPAFFRFPPNGKTIAVVGAGPAGLSAAWFLSMLGYACDVFESGEEAGGILRWGIPAYRLPADVLAFEINRIAGAGVRIFCNHRVTKERFDEMHRTYDAVFVGCGNCRSPKMGISGEEATWDGLSFLAAVRKGTPPEIEGEVAVIGGGNTAVDVSRTLVRLGISPTLVYRRRRVDMPAFAHEVDLAVEEGVRLSELLAPDRIEKEGEDLILHLKKMKIADRLSEGRATVVPLESQPDIVRVNHVIAAIGSGVSDFWHLPADGADAIALSHCTVLPGRTPVAYGGDLTNETQSVADAVASGKQAAVLLDLLMTEGPENMREKIDRLRIGNGSALSMEMHIGGQRKERAPHVVGEKEINLDYFTRENRTFPEFIPLRDLGRPYAFSENEKTLNVTSATKESGRCFNCGICNDCDNCRLFCPEMAVSREDGQPRGILLDYCKGCGICVVECPRNAINLKEEPQ